MDSVRCTNGELGTPPPVTGGCTRAGCGTMQTFRRDQGYIYDRLEACEDSLCRDKTPNAGSVAARKWVQFGPKFVCINWK